jgi:hypothetical protein
LLKKAKGGFAESTAFYGTQSQSTEIVVALRFLVSVE